jgi:hypothetical protein
MAKGQGLLPAPVHTPACALKRTALFLRSSQVGLPRLNSQFSRYIEDRAALDAPASRQEHVSACRQPACVGAAPRLPQLPV